MSANFFSREAAWLQLFALPRVYRVATTYLLLRKPAVIRPWWDNDLLAFLFPIS
jgi:hypothetical protein